MKFKWLFGLIAIVLCLSTVVLATGREWLPRNGVAIRQGWHIEWFRAGEARDAGVNAGEVSFVWSDTRFGDRGVFAQVVGTNGNLKFANNGIKISDAPGRQEDPGVWPDPDGGWFYAWEDFDKWTDDQGNVFGDSLGNIYCQKIDADGNRLWGDGDERGVPVCTAEGYQESVRIVHDGQGGCIIAWKDLRGGDVGDLYAMRILNDGTPDPDWPENGLAIVAEPGAQSSHTADVDGAGGMIIGWKDGRQVGDFDIWAQRVTPDGDLLWGEEQGIVICNNVSNQDSPKLCPDGQGGAFFSWVDDRNRQETNKDIFAQRVDSDGELMWGAAEDGIPLCTAQEEQINNRIVLSEPGTAIVLWEDKRANGNEYDLYAMRINGQNEMVKTWQPDQGKPVAIADRQQQRSRVYPDGEGGAYFAWEDERDGAYPEVDIWIQRLNVNGDAMWTENGIPVCRVDGEMKAPLIRTTTDGGAVIAWGDQRDGSPHLYAQRVAALDGRPIWDLNGIPLVAGLSMNATNHQILPLINGDNTFAVVWLDGRFAARGTVPFVQYCTDNVDNCDIELAQDGIPLISSDIVGGGISPRSVIAADNSVVVAWEDHRQNQNHSIYVQKVDQEGRRIWGPNGIRCADFPFDQNTPYICSDDDGGVIVAWKAPTDNDYFDIYMQRIDRNGQKAWGDNGLLLTGNATDELVEAIVEDGEGGAVVVLIVSDWELDDGLYMQRVNADGEPQWGDGAPIELAQEFYKQHKAVLLKHDEGFFVTWVDGRDDQANAQTQDDIFAQFVEPDGTFRWLDGGVEVFIDENQHQLAPKAAISTDGSIWVTWEDNRWGGPPRQKDVYLQKLSPNVDPEKQSFPVYYFDSRHALVVCSAVGDQVAPQIVSDDHNGVWLTWEDYRTGVWSDVYSIHLNEDGQRYPSNRHNGDMVCNATHKQNAPLLATTRGNGNTGIALVWEDKRATGKEELSNIYVQHMDDYAFDVPETERPNNPRGFALESVYPNPFNDKSIITFVSPVDGHVSLTVFDINGRMVKEIASDNWDAGRHLVVFDASGLAAGSYVIQLKANQVQLETKVQLLK